MKPVYTDQKKPQSVNTTYWLIIIGDSTGGPEGAQAPPVEK